MVNSVCDRKDHSRRSDRYQAVQVPFGSGEAACCRPMSHDNQRNNRNGGRIGIDFGGFRLNDRCQADSVTSQNVAVQCAQADDDRIRQKI